MSQKHSCFSWLWAHSRPKHAEKRTKHTKKNCVLSWLYLQDYTETHGQQNLQIQGTNFYEVESNENLKYNYINSLQLLRFTFDSLSYIWMVTVANLLSITHGMIDAVKLVCFVRNCLIVALSAGLPITSQYLLPAVCRPDMIWYLDIHI